MRSINEMNNRIIQILQRIDFKSSSFCEIDKQNQGFFILHNFRRILSMEYFLKIKFKQISFILTYI